MSNTAKKVVFSGSENAQRIYIKRGIYGHFLLFTNRKIQGFPNVFGSVNLRYSFHYPVVFLYCKRQKTCVFWHSPVG